MAFFNYPATIDKDTAAVASEVQTNFDDLLAWVLSNLIQKDGTVAMTAPLVLAPGDPGAPAHAANKAYVDAQMPVGVMMQFAGTSLPSGWLWCNGDTYTNTAQQKLAAAIGRTYTAAAVPVGSFQVPDMRKRVPVGFDATEAAKFGLGVTGGQRNSEVLNHQHTVPAHGHGHSISASSNNVWTDHLHDFTTAANGTHGHGWSAGAAFLYNDAGDSGYALVQGTGGIRSAPWTHDGWHAHSGTTGGVKTDYPSAANHSHTISVGGSISDKAAFNTNDGGGGTTAVDKNLQPYLVVNYIIYAGKV